MVPWYLSRRGPRRILAIDGGGMRGALAVGLLARLEAVLRARSGRDDLVLSDYFDLIGGTSTGAIIASGLALGKDTRYLANLYETLGKRVFHSRAPRVPLVQARFDPARLRQVIDEVLHDWTLETAPWKAGFAAILKRIDTGSSWVLTNCPRAKYWARRSTAPATAEGRPSSTLPNKDYRLAAVVQASAAAPFYFDMVRMEVGEGVKGAFFDGAMTPHNNPALQLAMTALVPEYGLRWARGADKLLIVSIGTGAPRPAHKEWAEGSHTVAALTALHALTSVSFDSSELAIAMLQWLGTSPQPWPINREIGSLDGASVGPPLWTFLRYDAPLEAPWLAAHGVDPPPDAPRLRQLARLDDYRQAEALYALGRQVGETLISPEHFPAAFDRPAGATN